MRTPSRIGSFLCIFIVIVLLALTGCAQGLSQTPATGTKPAAANTTLTPTPGGILRVVQAGEPPGYDLHYQLIYTPPYCMPIFNNLVRYDVTQTEVSPKTIVGDLAERWESSKDGLSYTFYLRKNVKWHDGKPFTADDVIYSMDKMVDPKRSTLQANFRAYKNSEKIDDYTVRMNLSKVQPSFIAQLAGPYEVIYAKHKAGVDMKSPDFLMGTGPFKYQSRISGVDFDLVKNPDYFKKDAAGRQLPYLDGMKFKIIPSASTQVDAFVTNAVDMTTQSTGITNTEALERYKMQSPKDKYEWVNYEGGRMWWFNLDYAPLKDVRVRRAIAMVTDLDLAVKAGFGSNDFRNSNVAIMPTAYGLDKTEVFKLIGWDQPYEKRVAEAQKLMKEAGYGEGFKFKLVCPGGATLQPVSEAMADSYKRYLKLDVELSFVPFAEYSKALSSGNFHAIRYGINTLVCDPDELVANFATGANLNYSKYGNPEVDKLLDQQGLELNFEKRRDICRQIERLILTDLPGIPEGGMACAIGMKSNVNGYVVLKSIYASHLQMERTWIAK
jgi:peptide/nickel transport system substrate-binding protein